MILNADLLYHVGMNEKEQKLLTTEQLAEILQVEVRYLYLLCKRGEIPHINIAPHSSKRPMYRFELDAVLSHWRKKDG